MNIHDAKPRNIANPKNTPSECADLLAKLNIPKIPTIITKIFIIVLTPIIYRIFVLTLQTFYVHVLLF